MQRVTNAVRRRLTTVFSGVDKRIYKGLTRPNRNRQVSSRESNMSQILQFRHVVVGVAVAAAATLCPLIGLASSTLELDNGLETQFTVTNSPAQGQGSTATRQPRETHGANEKFTAPFGGVVYFDVGQTRLALPYRHELIDLARWMSRTPASRVTIEGRTDDQGTRAYNLQLGFGRAARVRDFLISQRVAPSRILIISFGRDDFAPRCNDAQCRCLRRSARMTVHGTKLGAVARMGVPLASRTDEAGRRDR